MARFRKSGLNWQLREWYLAPGLVVLATQIETAWPDPEPGDGTVASKTHDQTSPNSDHRPSPHDAYTGAIVRAIDSGETSEAITQGIVDALVASQDPRIMYIIYEGRSCWSVIHNGVPAWRWQSYGGANPHEGHFHLSSKRTTTADNDTRPWNIGVPTGGSSLLPITPQSSDEDIRWLQDLLNYNPAAPLISVDGVYGPSTTAAVKAKTGSEGQTTAQKNGEQVGYRQWNSLYSYYVRRVDDDGGGGVTPGDVDAKIAAHAKAPPSSTIHPHRHDEGVSGPPIT